MTATPGFHALRCVGGCFGDSFFHRFEKMLYRAFDLTRENLIDRITPIGKIRAQRIVRQNRDFGSRVKLLRSGMPWRDDSQEKNHIRFLQKLLRLKTGMKRMSAREIDITG